MKQGLKQWGLNNLVSKKAYKLLSKLFVSEDYRPNINEILNHEYITSKIKSDDIVYKNDGINGYESRNIESFYAQKDPIKLDTYHDEMLPPKPTLIGKPNSMPMRDTNNYLKHKYTNRNNTSNILDCLPVLQTIEEGQTGNKIVMRSKKSN